MRVADLVAARREICSGNLSRTPKVSIITPTYKRNSEGLLNPCIESALAQSFSDIELIVIDDGSSDGTEDTVRHFAATDDRVRYFRHDRNSGLPAVRTNEGIMLARGDSVAFLFDDNVFEPNFISEAYEVLQSAAVDVVHANVHMLNAQGADFTLGNWPLCRELLGNLNTIPNGGVLCRRTFFDRYGMYDPHILLRRICDWDLWLRAFTLGASFRHLDINAATEHGLVSKNSLGNTVRWDVKVAYGYMLDTTKYAERSAKLCPQNIHEVDVLDTGTVLPYVRNFKEWTEVVEDVYEPFLAINQQARELPLVLTNRTELDHFGFRDHERVDAPGRRRRSLIVSNTVTKSVESWKEALSGSGDICLHVPEWQLSAVPRDTVDLLVLIDCCEPFLASIVAEFAEADIPIIYATNHSVDAPIGDKLNFANLPPIQKILGKKYFPTPGIPFSLEQAASASQLKQLSTAVLSVLGERNEHQWAVECPPDPSADWLRDFSKVVALFSRDVARRPSPPSALIALNSELLSGSEAYGIMLGQMLRSVGIEVKFCIPKQPVYGLEDNALAQRLLNLGFPPAKRISYFPNPDFLAQTREAQSRQIAKLEHEVSSFDPDLLVCSAFMPIFSFVRRDRAMLLMALFQPSAYNPEDLRKTSKSVDVWCSDSGWSHGILSELLGGTSAVVRSFFTPKLPSSTHCNKGTIRIAIGGTLQPRKGQKYAVRALKLLLDKGLDAVLNIYGYRMPSLAGYSQELESTIFALGLKDKVSIHGLNDLDRIASDNDIVLSASTDESLPQTVAECMSRGLIPVAVLSGGMDELIHHGINGFIAKDPAPEAIADALEQAIYSQDRWKDMKEASATVLSAYSMEKSRSSLTQLLERGHHVLVAANRNVDTHWSDRLAMFLKKL